MSPALPSTDRAAKIERLPGSIPRRSDLISSRRRKQTERIEILRGVHGNERTGRARREVSSFPVQQVQSRSGLEPCDLRFGERMIELQRIVGSVRVLDDADDRAVFF